MSRIVSAEEARRLLDGAMVKDIEIVRHDNDGGEINWQIALKSGRKNIRSVHFNSSDLEGPNVRTIAKLLAAAPDLAHTVATLTAERDRLRDILDCETGKRAPEGWTRVSTFDCEWENQRTDMRVDNLSPGEWQAFRWSGQHDYTVGDPQPTALEAIEQADDCAQRVYAKEPA